jgi:arginase family enzyme
LKSLAGPNWILNEPPLPNGDKPARIAAVNQRLAQLVSRAVSGGRRPVSIAGDCMSAIGVLAGLDVTSIPENKPPCGDHGSAA